MCRSRQSLSQQARAVGGDAPGQHPGGTQGSRRRQERTEDVRAARSGTATRATPTTTEEDRRPVGPPAPASAVPPPTRRPAAPGLRHGRGTHAPRGPCSASPWPLRGGPTPYGSVGHRPCRPGSTTRRPAPSTGPPRAPSAHLGAAPRAPVPPLPPAATAPAGASKPAPGALRTTSSSSATRRTARWAGLPRRPRRRLSTASRSSSRLLLADALLDLVVDLLVPLLGRDGEQRPQCPHIVSGVHLGVPVGVRPASAPAALARELPRNAAARGTSPAEPGEQQHGEPPARPRTSPLAVTARAGLSATLPDPAAVAT